jgi:MFS family permease
MIGVIFSMDTITYTLSSFILNFIPEKSKNFNKLVACGMLTFTLAMFLTGPAPGVFPDEVYIICIGVLVGGVGGALVNNNCVPALTQTLHNDFSHLDINGLKNNLSAINTGAFGLGSILGPIAASLLDAAFDFRWSFTIISAIVLVVALFQFISAFCMTTKKTIRLSEEKSEIMGSA